MEILLNPERQKFIQKQLEVGKYRNHDEAINVALFLLEKLDREYTEWLEETRQKVAILTSCTKTHVLSCDSN